MDHNLCRENLSAYLDGELPQGERLALETHLAGCADCRAELAGLKKVSGLVKAHAMEPVPPALRGAVLKEKPRTAGPWLKPVLAFATAAGALLVVFNLTKTDENYSYSPGFGAREGGSLYETGFSAREAAPAAEKDMSANEFTQPQAQAPTRAPAGAEAGGSAAASGLYPAENKKAAVAAARGSYAQAKFASRESYDAMLPSTPRPRADGGETVTAAGNTADISCKALNSGKAPSEAQLTPLMKEFLSRFSPDFKLRPLEEYSAKVLEHYCYSPGSSPSAVIGDFNGDGRPDAYLVGYEKAWLAAILLISNGPDAYYPIYAGRQKYENLEAAVKNCALCFDREKKLVYAYYLQPRGASYSCGGDYSRIKRTLNNDGIALLQTWKNGLYVNYVSIWDDIGKRYVEQHCVLNPCDGSDCP
jgi:anti-sigma factor RsiW